jgi:YHS domain-containing protein
MYVRFWALLARVMVVLFVIGRSASGQEHEHAAGSTSVMVPREASGTAWQPDVTPMYGFHRQTGAWEVMLHGNGFLQLLHEAAPGDRGGTQAGSINWMMVMAARPLGAGRFGVHAMMSLEPLTIPGCGYPNLLASGERCDGDAIHDRQHPHDLFMELAGHFDRAVAGSTRWQVYAGLAGEPALGPPGFPHRLSAMPDPLSPIAHHWLDSTHITYGVLTTGVYGSGWKGEASIFNGREPDDRRYDLDLAALDSFSGRFWLVPTPSLALQVSAGHLKEAEVGHGGVPRLDVDRVTASATYHRRFGGGHLWATTLAWGANREEDVTSHGLTAESSATFSNRHTWFGRVELNGKTADDLDLHQPTGVFTVGKIQGGYTRYLDSRYGLTPGIGGSLSAAFVPDVLQPRYGGRVGFGLGLFFTVRPVAHDMAAAVASASSATGGHVMVRTALDPAKLSCSPTIDPKTAATTTYEGKAYFFCSTKDRDMFLTNPAMSLVMMPPKQ